MERELRGIACASGADLTSRGVVPGEERRARNDELPTDFDHFDLAGVNQFVPGVAGDAILCGLLLGHVRLELSAHALCYPFSGDYRPDTYQIGPYQHGTVLDNHESTAKLNGEHVERREQERSSSRRDSSPSERPEAH